MNYYEHHIGDYAQATAHLSILEDGAYIRCIRKYYADEKPLPADIAAVQRLVGARTREERLAQRLLRVICPHCAEPHAADAHELAWLQANSNGTPDIATLRHGRGCSFPHCLVCVPPRRRAGGPRQGAGTQQMSATRAASRPAPSWRISKSPSSPARW